jgi:soluble lytic murein transglycosylase-like protein
MTTVLHHHRSWFVSLMAFVLIQLCALPARAELAFFANGRTLSIKSHRIDGDSLTLTLRNGGEIVCESSTIARFAPDEVPYPEPEPVAAPAVEAASTVPYGEIIDKISAQHGVDAKLVRAVIQVESAYRQTARSRKGAMGLMQLMPDIAQAFGVEHPFDPRENIMAGARLLRELLDQYHGNVKLAVAGYNAGPTAVDAYGGVPPFRETQGYVKKVTELIAAARRAGDGD